MHGPALRRPPALGLVRIVGVGAAWWQILRAALQLHARRYCWAADKRSRCPFPCLGGVKFWQISGGVTPRYRPHFICMVRVKNSYGQTHAANGHGLSRTPLSLELGVFLPVPCCTLVHQLHWYHENVPAKHSGSAPAPPAESPSKIMQKADAPDH